MDTLFDVSRSGLVSLGDVDCLQGIPPKTWIWLHRLYNNGDLELVARALVRSGLIKEGSEAPAFLAEIVAPATQRTRNLSISFGDLQRRNHVRLRDFLMKCLGKEAEDEPSLFALCTSLGRVTHRFAEWLYTHNVRFEKPRQVSLFETGSYQTSLFGTIPKIDDIFGNDHSLAPSENRRRFDPAFLQTTSEYIRKFSGVLDSPMEYARLYFTHANNITQFRNLMEATFPEHYAMLASAVNMNGGEALALSSLVGWTGLLKRRLYEDRSTTSLTEVPVSPRDAEVWAGRIDRLVVLNGKTDVFRNLCRQNVESASDFVEQALRLHPSTRFRIVDLKCSVGDFEEKAISSNAFAKNKPAPKNEDDQKKALELSLTLAKHVSQVQWYVLWLTLRHEIVNGRSGQKLPDDRRFTGLLTYVLPNGELVDVPVEPAPEELQRRFVEQVVYHWQTINGTRDARNLNNTATNALRHLTNGENGGGKNGDHHNAGNWTHTTATNTDALPTVVPAGTPRAVVPAGTPPAPIQELLIPGGLETHPILDLVDSYRRFVGTADVIQEIRFGDTVRYRMHLGLLARAIEAGEIVARSGFSWERGGFICCLLHKEKTPSMHLAFERGTFKCFGCGAFGTFAREDLPANLASIVPAEHIGARRATTAGLPKISEETEKIMAAAQEILSRNFPGSMAEHYLTTIRYLDRDLVRAVGAGCAVRDGRDVLIEELLGAGYSLDDLVAQGFLNYSDRAKGWSPAVRALRKHGLSDDVIAHREPKKSMSSGTIEVVSWPFDSLSGRATFPLSLPIGSRAITTGFYGRHATGEKSNLPHFVLTPSDTPKGIFNGREIAELIAEGGVEKLYPTEAVIDALVIKTIGYGPVISIVGTAHTEHLKRLILNLNPGEVNVALDFDSAGEEATMGGKTRQGTIRGLIPWLQDAGYRGELVNFAAAFAMNHPEVAKLDCDDFGTWWERYGRHHRQPF